MRLVDHSAMGVVGYTTPWSVAAGRSVSLSLSVAAPVEAVGLRRLDRDGMPEVPWPVVPVGGPPGHRSFPQGSFAQINASELDSFGPLNSLEIEFLLTRNAAPRPLLTRGDFALLADGDELILRTGGTERLRTGTIPQRRWLRLAVDLPAGELRIDALDPYRPYSGRWRLGAAIVPGSGDLALFGGDATLPTLNGRLARLRLSGPAGVAEFRIPARFQRAPIAAASGDCSLQLTLFNNPTFCVTSPRWDGTSHDPRLVPEHYDALHFHDTDSGGWDWPASHAVHVPRDAEPGVYAFEVQAGGQVERIAFFVTAVERRAPLLYVVPTATYLAYANEHLPPELFPWQGSDRGHLFARDNDLRSLYDFHSDGSGVSITSMNKPRVTLRDDYAYPLCGDPHLLPVDLHFLRFCGREEIDLDLITDFELHQGGAALLAPYAGVVTGSHPEYLSVAMEDAYRSYVGGGGNLAYLGGNGFAAAVAFDGDLMELRRGPTQVGRTWDGPLAEMSFALDNEPAGYLRDRGRGEFSLTGVGIALMGFSRALPFTRTAESRSPEHAWLFEGVAADRFGADGLVLGGAAGYEVDRTNVHLGSPEDIVVLATATGYPADYVGDPGKWYAGGEAEIEAHRRAEMTLWRHPAGGIVFSASSCCWCGALPGPGAQNDVGRITANLLRQISRG